MSEATGYAMLGVEYLNQLRRERRYRDGECRDIEPTTVCDEAAIGDGENQVRAKLLGLLEERKANAVSVFMGRP